MSTRTIRIHRDFQRTFETEFERVPPPDPAAPATEREYPVTFSSEQPVRRFGWDIGEYDEVLSHDPADVDMSRAKNGLIMVASHDIRTPIGRVRDVAIGGRKPKMGGVARFSSILDGQKWQTLVDEGIVTDTSLGYRITGMTLVSVDKKTGVPTYRCSWMPYEVSPVSVPADTSVGFGRGLSLEEMRRNFAESEFTEVQVEIPDHLISHEGVREMSTAAGAPPPLAEPQAPPAAAPAATPAAPAAPSGRTEAGRDFAVEQQNLVELAELGGRLIQDNITPIQRALDWMRRGVTPQQAQSEMHRLVSQGRAPAPTPPASEGIDAPRRDRIRYNLARALYIELRRKEGHPEDFNGVEAEYHQELRRNAVGGDHSGIRIPLRFKRTEEDEVRYLRELMARGLAPAEWGQTGDRTRTLATNISAGGQSLVFTEPMDYIDALRNRALVLKKGVRFYGGLTSNVQFMKKTGTAQLFWVGENPNTGVTPSGGTYGAVNMSPKPLSGRVDFSRLLLRQAQIDVQSDVDRDLLGGHALALDRVFLVGTGTNNQPLGLWYTPNVSSVAFNGAGSLREIVKMTTKLAKNNALDLAYPPSWMVEPEVAGGWMSTPIEPGVSKMIWEGNHLEGIMAGWPAQSTNQIPDDIGATGPGSGEEKGAVFANWTDGVIGVWGNDVELVVDETTLADFGNIRVILWSAVDCGIVRPESFCVASGLTLISN